MKRLFPIVLFLFIFNVFPAFNQGASDTTVYLITCSPGTETYSIWGHSAIRVVIGHTNTDDVYNWGVFDFATKNFAWKFAKGRLNYMLGVYPYDRFLQGYMLENRSVWLQKVNLEPVEKLRLMLLVQENLRPENKTYRYDFFDDNCSTRIRDLFEKIYGNKLIYPPEDMSNAPTFRDKIREYQVNYPWLTMGTDLLIGTPAEQKTTFRERMFLPYDLQRNLTQSVINRDRRMEPMLGRTETILDFPSPETNRRFFTSPMFVFSLILIVLIILSALYGKSHFINYIDIAVFLLFSVIALLMVFFNFFTDQVQTRMNMNIIWFNPVILICLFLIIFGREGLIWFRIVFLFSLIFIPAIMIFPGGLNNDYVPVVLILTLRSSARSKFSWNPFTV